MRYECGETREMILAEEEGSTRRKFNIIPSMICSREHFYEQMYARKQHKVTNYP
jgi:hypothetical protein